MRRRTFLLAAGSAAFAKGSLAQTGHPGHDHYESLQKPGRIGLPALAQTQRFADSPAPMPTPRHGLGAAVVGGGVQSAVHEAFMLA